MTKQPLQSSLKQRHRKLVPNNSWSLIGFLLSPTLFNIFLERIMKDALKDHEGTVSIGGRTITKLRFADDMMTSMVYQERKKNWQN